MLCFFGLNKIDIDLCQDFLGKSDPYLEILRATSDGSWQVVHRTEVSVFVTCNLSVLLLCC